ncbi:MAG: putative sensor domain DACNV-containing protein [Candidatus Binatia bacterium]
MATLHYAYPQDLAAFLREHWDEPTACTDTPAATADGVADPLPDTSVLETLLSICYQASLLREEERPVRFRLTLRAPDQFPASDGPPTGLHRLMFTAPRPCTAHELQRLAPAVEFYRSLIGVWLDQEQRLYIWGMVYSGPRWLQAVHGGRDAFQVLPLALVVRVTAPGRIAVCKGLVTLATLNGGRIVCPALDVFDSRWLPESFAAARAELWSLHAAAQTRENRRWAPLDTQFVQIVAQNMVRRMLSLVRNAHHGGTLIYLPPDRAAEFCGQNPYLTLKYTFADEEPRQRMRTLTVRLMNALAEAYGQYGFGKQSVGWNEYMTSRDPTLTHLDEAIFELAHLIAGLFAVDGAVVLTKRFELLGFGGEISGALDQASVVARALDAEGEQTEPEFTDGVGTRHRSVYRLCHAVHDIIAVVISQDGNIRFVKWKDGMVTYWDQVTTSVLDI